MSRHILSITAAAVALFSAMPGYAEMLLNDVMDSDVQRKTGVEDLSPKQKRILEAWINDTFVLKTKTEEPAKETSNLYLSINVNNGQQIRLSDGSLWDIDPSDTVITATWITPFAVKIAQSGNPTYPTLLINLNNNVSVRAKPTTTLAPSPTVSEPTPETPEPTAPPATTPPQPQATKPPAPPKK